MCLAAQCCTALRTTMRILQLSSPSGTPAPRSTECITTLPTPRLVPSVGWIRAVLCQRVAFQLLLTLFFDQSWRSFAHITTQAPNSSPAWMTGICGSNHSTYHRQSMSSLQPPDQSTLLYSPPRHKYGKSLATEFQDKVTLTLSCLGGHLQIHGDTEPSPVVVGEKATMEKTTQRFQKIATTLADLNAEGLNVQAVNDLLTMYAGAASEHVFRMSFVPEQEAHNFDRQVMTFWSHLIQRDIISPLFFLPLKLGGLGVGSAVQRHAAAPWRAWQSIIPTLMTTTQSPDTDSLFSSTPRLRAQLAQLQTTLSLQMSKPTFQLKPLGAALRLKKNTQKKQVSTIKETYTNNSTTASPTHPLNKPYSCHNPLHIPVRISCSRAVKRTRLRIAVFVSQ